MLRHMDGFDQFQGQAGNALLTSLTSLGYNPAPGMALVAGRHPSTWALELQVTAGSAGLSWSSRPNNINRALRGVCHNGVRWIAVGDAGIAAISEDSVSWQPVVTGSTASLTGVAAGNSRAIAIGPTGTILVSPDGSSWSQIALPRPGIVIYDIDFAEGVFMLVGAEGTQGIILRTTDGNDVEQVASNIPSPLRAVAFGNGIWMAGGDNGVMRTSTDATGNLWSPKTLQTGVSISGIAYGEEGVWLATQGRNVYRSITAGENWVIAAANLATTNESMTKIRYSSGLWAALTSGGRIFTSSDQLGETFTLRVSATSYISIYGLNFSKGALGGWVAVGRGRDFAQIYVSVSPPTVLRRTFNSEAKRVVFSFAHRATARGKIFAIDGLLDINWPRGIEILGQEGAAVPIRNVWYYYELVIDKVNGKIELWINNHLDLTTTLPTAAQAMASYEISWQAENGATARIDDVVLIDSDPSGGSEIVDRIGPVQIPILRPTADVTTEFEVEPPGIPHFQAVGQLPPSTASYIRSAVSGKQDIFTSANPLPEGAGTEDAPIFAVGVMALAQKSDLDARQLGLRVGTGVDQLEVIDEELSTNWEYSLGIFEKAPGNADWDETNIEGLEFGVAVRP